MENRVENVEHRMNNMEVTMEQIRQMMIEQHSQPQMTMNQIRQLIRGQPRQRHRNQGRPQGRGNHDNNSDDDGSGMSDASSVSQPRRRRNNDGNSWRFNGSRRRLEVPVFKGEDVYGWLVRVERYFRLNEIRTQDKVDAVVLALEEKSLNWFQWWKEQAPLRTWEEFKLAVIRRFQPGLLHNPLGPLLSLKQKGAMMEYRDKFEMLVAPLRREEKGMLDSIFLNGLKEEIQAELKMYESHDLAE